MKRKKLRIVPGQCIYVKPKDIPKYILDGFASETLYAVERYFALPGVQEKFQEWLVEYRKRPGIADRQPV